MSGENITLESYLAVLERCFTAQEGAYRACVGRDGCRRYFRQIRGLLFTPERGVPAVAEVPEFRCQNAIHTGNLLQTCC
jgi:hypothetical protein